MGDREQDVAKRFASDVANHEMEIIRDDGSIGTSDSAIRSRLGNESGLNS